jgi:hypothetical protein
LYKEIEENKKLVIYKKKSMNEVVKEIIDLIIENRNV